MNKTGFTSDLHLMHNRPFIYIPRGFETIEEMNKAIVHNFNEVLDDADDLYILGDSFLNDNDGGMELLRKLPGKKHIIWGNHDTDARKRLMEQEFDCLGYATTIRLRGYTFYLSHYPTMTSNHDDGKPLERRILSLSGHTHSKEVWDAAGGYNVALDAHNCYPVMLDEVIEAFKNRG